MHRKERSNCLVCKEKVNTLRAKFCSIKCAALYNAENKIKEKPACLFCGNPTKRVRSKFCSVTCANAHRQELFIQNWLDGKENGKRGNAETSKRLKRWLRETCGNKCSKCGWNEINPFTGLVPVRLDHIDGNWENNKPENLRLLCPNCDSLTETYCALNKGKGRPYFVQKGVK